MKEAIKIILIALGMAVIWVAIAVLGAAMAFVFGRMSAKLLGWY